MYCNEKNTYRNRVTFVCTVLFRLKHCFYLGECVIKALKLNLLRQKFYSCIVYCPLTGGYFRPCGPQIRVRVRLREVSVYGRLKMQCFREEITGTAVWCPLMGSVRLRRGVRSWRFDCILIFKPVSQNFCAAIQKIFICLFGDEMNNISPLSRCLSHQFPARFGVISIWSEMNELRFFCSELVL